MPQEVLARSGFYIVPAAFRDVANLVGFALGLGPNTFSMGAAPTAQAPATHYFGHATEISEELGVIFGAMPLAGGTLPEIEGEWGEEWNDVMLPSMGQAKAACAVMQVSIQSNIGALTNQAGVLFGLGLVVKKVGLG